MQVHQSMELQVRPSMKTHPSMDRPRVNRMRGGHGASATSPTIARVLAIARVPARDRRKMWTYDVQVWRRAFVSWHRAAGQQLYAERHAARNVLLINEPGTNCTGRRVMTDSSALMCSSHTSALPSRSGRIFIALVLLAALLTTLAAGSTEGRKTRNADAIHTPQSAEQTHTRNRSGAAAMPALPGANRPATPTVK